MTRGPGGVEAWPGWEDAAVRPERMGSYLREFDALLGRHGRRGAYYGHFGDGCLHVRIDFDLLTTPGVTNFRAFLTDAADLVVAHGGSLSGEHGDGQARAELLARMYSPRMLDAFARFKHIWDPDDRMNPGRVVEPRRIDDDLRVFLGQPTISMRTELAFANDDGSFASATRRCIGVAKCVTDHGGVMCPSYRVTGEETHSTRGRARMLFEMASGQLVADGWRSTEVRNALDLCLSCKGCQRDCPVGVDMATYKAEFLARHYAGRARERPRSHWSMGHLPRWLRLATAVPGLPRLANALARRPALAALAKRVGGIARSATSRRWPPPPAAARRRPPRPPRHREAPPAAVAGHLHRRVRPRSRARRHRRARAPRLPRRAAPVGVCCGLTWVTTGQLGSARAVLRRSLTALKPWLDDGVAIVGLEPSCTAALAGDARHVLGDTEQTRRLEASVRTFAQILAEHTDELAASTESGRSALVQIHCHQYAESGFDADRAVLDALGVDADVLDEGCCGLAGNFGFEEGHYEVSTACAERGLMPAVRAASADTAVLADGFSCRTQIRQMRNHGHEPIHLARLAADCLGVRS